MKKISSLLLIMLLSASIPAFADGMRIAIMDLKADGVSDRTARTVSNMIRTEFVNLERFIVVERNQMNEIMKEQGLQKTGCTDQACAVQLGRLMSARKILVGEVSPMGKSIVMTVRIVDVEKGISEFAATEKAPSEDVLDEAVSRISEKLASRIDKDVAKIAKKERKKKKKEEPEKETPGDITPLGYYLRGAVPGWGQFYVGNTVRGYVFSGTSAVTLTLWMLAHISYTKKKDDYDKLGPDLPQSEYDSKYDDYQKAGNTAKVTMVLFAASYLANWIDIIFFSRPDFSSRSGSLDNGSGFLAVDVNYLPVSPTEKITTVGYGMRF